MKQGRASAGRRVLIFPLAWPTFSCGLIALHLAGGGDLVHAAWKGLVGGLAIWFALSHGWYLSRWILFSAPGKGRAESEASGRDWLIPGMRRGISKESRP